MGSKQADIIASYVTRVGDIQRTRSDTLADEELKSIALELGLKPADIARADQAADEHLRRAENYVSHDMFDDAIDQIRAAVVLRPLDSSVIRALAEAYAARWHRENNLNDRDEADRLARQAIDMDPDDQAAFALRKRLQGATRTAPPSRSSAAPAIIAIMVGVGVVFAGLTVAIGGSAWFLLSANDPPPPAVEVLQPVEAPVVAVPTPPGDVTISFTPSDLLPGAELSPAASELSIYESSWSFKSSGRLLNDSGTVITELKGEILLKDASGNVVATDVFDVQQDYQAPLRPGEVRGYDSLIYEDSLPAGFSAPVSAELRITEQTHETAAAQYPPDTPVTLSWGAAGPPPGVSVSAAKRTSAYTESILDRIHNRAEYVFTVDEGSAAVSMLKVQIEYFDANGKPIRVYDIGGNISDEPEISYVSSTSEPPLEPGEARPIVFLAYVEAAAAEERLTVVEVR